MKISDHRITIKTLRPSEHGWSKYSHQTHIGCCENYIDNWENKLVLNGYAVIKDFGVKRISFNTHSTSDRGHTEELVKEKLIQKTTFNPNILRLLEDIKRKKKAEVEQNIAQLIGIKIHQMEVENVTDQLTINITFYLLKHYRNPELKTIEQFKYIREIYIQGAADPSLKLQIFNIFNSLEPLVKQIINMRKSLQGIVKPRIRFDTHSISDTGYKDLIKEAKPRSFAVLPKRDSKSKIKQRHFRTTA